MAFDYQFGEVPFFEWGTVGGLSAAEGIGGQSSVRGVPRLRFGGNVKVFSNTELRFYVWDFPLLGQRTRVGGHRRGWFGGQVRGDQGASAVEYGLLVALIAVIVAGTVWALGGALKTQFSSVCETVAGEDAAECGK